MGWGEWSYKKRGGVIGLVYSLIIVAVIIVDPSFWSGLFDVISTVAFILFIPIIFLCGFLTDGPLTGTSFCNLAQSSIFLSVYTMITSVLVGMFLGWIVGKIIIWRAQKS